ncbi:MAG: DUF1223 domain-containing protein [Hyphomicrobiales bacterium]
MKKIYLKDSILALIMMIMLPSLFNACPVSAQGYYPKDNNRGFALLELYSSQGCNSCPPADELISSIQDKAWKTNMNIISINYHVDYWNYLGWKDPFSKALFSMRQYNYAELFGLRSVYTPQLIINGSMEMIGSDKIRVEQTINNVLEKKPRNAISNLKTNYKDNKLFFSADIDGTTKDKDIYITLLQNNASTNVKEGENKGRTLKNTNIARTLIKIPISKMKSIKGSVDLPEDLERNNMSIVLFIQDNTNGHISGAIYHNLKQ